MQKNGLSLTWVFHDWEFFDNFDNWWMEKFCGEVSHESKQSVKNYQNVSSQDSQSAVLLKLGYIVLNTIEKFCHLNPK